MTPTLRQRFGLDPLDPSGDPRALAAARAAATSFLVQAAIVLLVAAVGGDVGAPTLVAVAAAVGIAATILAAYERLPRSVKRLFALSGTVIVAELTFFQANGELYAPLYLGVVIYVSFFFNRIQAFVQVTAAAALWGLALWPAHPPVEAFQIWILGAGAMVAAAAIMRVTRRHFLDAAERAQSSRAALDAFFRHAPAGFGVLDGELRHLRVNEALAEIVGLPAAEIVGKTLREVAPENGDILVPLARTVLETGRPVIGVEVEDGRGISYLVSYYPVPGPHGTAGVGTAITDVTHLKDVERKLEETNRRLTVLATTDELTGLPNRRMLDEQLELALARARRGGLAVALLAIDLDRFKEVNDSLGHAIGDDLLVEAARRLRAGARDTDVVARIGGDEFVVLLADLDVQEASELARTVVERLHGVLADPVAIGPVELKLEASIGVAVYPLDSRDAKGLLAAADAAMYAGKNALTRVA